MSQRTLHGKWSLVAVALAAMFSFPSSTWERQAMAATEEKSAKAAAETAAGGPVVRSFGSKGGYVTEVTSETKGTLSEEDRRQVSLLAAQVFQHIDEARLFLDAGDPRGARQEVDKGLQALKAARAILPTTNVTTKTIAPDGKVIYEDQRGIQEFRVPLFEGMVSAKTLAPILAAKQDNSGANGLQEGVELTGVRLISSETITTQVIADLNIVQAQLGRVAKALDENKVEDAATALLVAQVRGVDVRYDKEDSPLAAARDAMWLAKRSLEENNAEQAKVNLRIARQSLRLYQQVAADERRDEVDQMLKEVNELETKLGLETAQKPATSGERKEQGESVTDWWERINRWFRRG